MISVNLGEKQLVTVTIVSCPISNKLFDVGEIANETWEKSREMRQEMITYVRSTDLFMTFMQTQ